MRLAVAVAVLFLSGCGHVIDGAPTKEPTRLDCNLIFPGPDPRR